MSRNASGTYTLPAGNPVIDGTTITVGWANGTLNDIATEMTDSLDRSGKGAMLAAFKAVDGSLAAPGITWANDLDCGLFRAGANDVRMSVGGVLIQQWTASGATFPQAVTFTTGFVVDWTETTLTDTGHVWNAEQTFGAFVLLESGFSAYDGQSDLTFNDDALAALVLSNSAGAPLRMTPSTLPATGVKGDLYVTSAGVLKICTVAGSPGTWVSVGAQT